jgi:hypothetical protein
VQQRGIMEDERYRDTVSGDGRPGTSGAVVKL